MGADKAKVLGHPLPPAVRKREENVKIISVVVDLPGMISDRIEWLEDSVVGFGWVVHVTALYAQTNIFWFSISISMLIPQPSEGDEHDSMLWV